MRPLILQMALSLDGFVADRSGGADWPAVGASDSVERWQADSLFRAGAHLMGSTTYWDMRSYWPRSTELLAGPINDVEKIVFSRSDRGDAKPSTKAQLDMEGMAGDGLLAQPNVDALDGWDRARWLTGELHTGIQKLKDEPGEPLFAHGGASFASALVASGLVDVFSTDTTPGRPG